jgi:hypothetical protein
MARGGGQKRFSTKKLFLALAERWKLESDIQQPSFLYVTNSHIHVVITEVFSQTNLQGSR